MLTLEIELSSFHRPVRSLTIPDLTGNVKSYSASHAINCGRITSMCALLWRILQAGASEKCFNVVRGRVAGGEIA